MHDYPQARGLAAARALFERHAHSASVLAAVRHFAQLEDTDNGEPLNFDALVLDRIFSRPFELPASRSLGFPLLPQSSAEETGLATAPVDPPPLPPLRFWMELITRRICDVSGEVALEIMSGIVEGILGMGDEREDGESEDGRRPRTVSAGDVDTVGGPVMFPRDSVLQIAALFRGLDKDKDDNLTMRDFELLLPQDSPEFQTGQFRVLLDVFDRDNDAEITFHEFLKTFREMAMSARLETPKFGPITTLLTTFEDRLRALITQWTAELSCGYFE